MNSLSGNFQLCSSNRFVNFEKKIDTNSSSDVLLDNLENIILQLPMFHLRNVYEKTEEASDFKKVVRAL